MESSRRDLSNDMAEHWPTSKNNQNTHHPRFGFTPKTGIAFPKTGVLFLLYNSYYFLLSTHLLHVLHRQKKTLPNPATT